MCGIPRFPRLIRGLWPDRNPLRRRSDRAEAALVTRLLAAAITAGQWAYVAWVRADHAKQAWHQVRAVLLLGTWRLARRALERRGMAAWEANWLVTGPRWTSRR